MKAILHIGMPKTGSTQIQAVLGRNRKALLQHGILYPENTPPLKSQTFLVAAMKMEDQGRTMKALFPTQEALDYFFVSSAESVRSQIETSQPKSVILSSEMLFRAMSNSAFDRIRAFLDSFADELEVVCYVRHPADHYRSIMLQEAKQCSVVRAPGAVDYRDALEAYLDRFPELQVLQYDRSVLQQGSVVFDFIMRFLNLDPMSLRLSDHSNESLSAEGMELVRTFRATMRPHHDNLPDEASRRYEDCIRSAENSLARKRRARLKGDIANHVIAASIDVLWIRDMFGIEFDDLDYSSVGCDLPPLKELKSISQVCEFDQSFYRELQFKALELALLKD